MVKNFDDVIFGTFIIAIENWKSTNANISFGRCVAREGGGIRHDPLRRQFDFGGRDWTTDGFVYHLHTPHKTNQPERSSQKILVIEATPLNAIHSWPPVAALTFDKTKLSASCTEPGCTYIAHWKKKKAFVIGLPDLILATTLRPYCRYANHS